MSHAEEDVANSVANFTVKNVVPVSSKRASAKAIVKDHSSCVAMRGGVEIVAFYGSISELCYPKVKIGVNINYLCQPY